jgi:CDP-diglyceride synthetase
MVYISFLAKKNKEIEAYLNNFAISLVFLGSITLNLIIISYYTPKSIDFIVFPFDIFMLFFIVFFLPLFYLLIIREKKRLKRGSEQPYYPKKDLPLKYDLYRKLTHLVVLAIILFYFTLGFLVKNFFVYLLNFFPEMISEIFYTVYNIEEDTMIFTQYLVVFLVGISLIGLLTADFIRILKPKIYPLKPVNQILREKELHMRLGPQISMAIGCFSIIILFGIFQPIGPLVICVSMTMAIFSDMASTLVGRSIGYKYKNIRNTKKTYIGLFAGIIIAFFSGIIILYLLKDFFLISPICYYIIPLIGAIIIGLLDYLDFEIDDNLSYNICLSTILFVIMKFIL